MGGEALPLVRVLPILTNAPNAVRRPVTDAMISTDDERYILAQAYVPEHIVGLMTGISRGEPFLIDGYVGFSKDNWVILVGYPLAGGFDHEDFGRIIAGTITSFRPE